MAQPEAGVYKWPKKLNVSLIYREISLKYQVICCVYNYLTGLGFVFIRGLEIYLISRVTGDIFSAVVTKYSTEATEKEI
jgi:hypothetical protein